MNAKNKVSEILEIADIRINGNRPWDIQVHDERLYNRVLSGGTMALGESYMDGWWDVEDLSEFFSRVLLAKLNTKISKRAIFFNVVKAKIMNLQSLSRAKIVCEEHYDIGNDLYKKMLDKRMVYTCGFWRNAKNLDEAQEAKLDLICKKIHLKKGDKVLDIGCGFGSFAKFAAEKYGAEVVGITISKEQLKLAQENTKGLSVEIKFQDYRDISGTFDKIVSIGMFEAVGYKNFRNFMVLVHRVLKDNGLFLLHTIGNNEEVFTTDPWVDKYIFPNGMLPSPKGIGESIDGLFTMEDWHSFGTDYDKTLMKWYENFDNTWSDIGHKYNERFYRMWKYYLLSCAGGFRSRYTQLWQIVLSKEGIPGGYDRIV